MGGRNKDRKRGAVGVDGKGDRVSLIQKKRKGFTDSKSRKKKKDGIKKKKNQKGVLRSGEKGRQFGLMERKGRGRRGGSQRWTRMNTRKKKNSGNTC